MSALVNLRCSLRGLGKNPGSTMLAILVLALGIGAPTAIFSTVNALLLRPLPYQGADRLVQIYETFPLAEGHGRGSVSVPNLLDWRQRNRTLEGIAAYSLTDVSLQGIDLPQRLRAAAVSADLFQLLGVQRAAGRIFLEEDGRPGAPAVAVLSHGLGRRRSETMSDLIGSELTLDGVTHTVIGVMPPHFRFPPGNADVDLWLPLRWEGSLAENRTSHWLSVVARLAPDATLEAAQEDMSRVARSIEEEHPEAQEGRGVHLLLLREVVTGRVRPVLLLLLGASGLVFLVACANTANLLLVRSLARRREFAIRTALGAGVPRLVPLFMAEAAVLAGAGMVLGSALAWAGVRWLVQGSPRDLPARVEAGFDFYLALFVLVVTALMTLALGLTPVFQIRESRVESALRESGGKATLGTFGRRFRGALVVIQVGLCLVLLTGSGLLVKTILVLLATDSGMDIDSVLTLRVRLPENLYGGERAVTSYFEPARSRAGALPEIAAAGWTNVLPLQDWGFNGNIEIEGRPLPETAHEAPFAEWRFVSPGYFSALGIRILDGRAFRDDDLLKGAPWVVMVNRALAERYFPRHSPLGQVIRIGGARLTIVGIAENVRQATLDRPPLAEIYIPYTLGPQTAMTLVARTRVPPLETVSAVRSALFAIDPTQPIYDVFPMAEVLGRSIADRRLYLQLLSLFAVVALALAGAGIYSVVSYLAGQRKQEIGIRIALGAQRGSVLRLVVGEGLKLAVLGILLGVPVAMSAGGLLANLLYGVGARDLQVLLGVVVVLCATAVLASLWPALRASRVNPIVAIWAE